MALQLKRAGVRKVRPLEGGFESWLELGFPVESIAAEAPSDRAAPPAVL